VAGRGESFAVTASEGVRGAAGQSNGMRLEVRR
jgi:hypothetical protein